VTATSRGSDTAASGTSAAVVAGFFDAGYLRLLEHAPPLRYAAIANTDAPADDVAEVTP
jgi:hypothetical protein